MKTILMYLSGFACLFMILQACNPVSCPKTKNELINQFNQFVSTTVKTKQYYTIREWESKDKEFNGFIQDCYPLVDTTFYLDDKQKFWSDALRYYFKRYDNRVTLELLHGKNPNSKIILTQIRSIWSNPDEAFTQIFNEITGLKFDEALEAVRDSSNNLEQ